MHTEMIILGQSRFKISNYDIYEASYPKVKYGDDFEIIDTNTRAYMIVNTITVLQDEHDLIKTLNLKNSDEQLEYKT